MAVSCNIGMHAPEQIVLPDFDLKAGCSAFQCRL